MEDVLKVQCETVSGCRRKLKVEIPDTELKKEVDVIYQKLAKTAKVPGFRPGKAPRSLLEKRYSSEANDELLKTIIPQAYSKALEENKLKPVGNPQVEVKEFKENEILRFEATLDVQPEFKLKKYTGISLTKKKVEVTDKDVDQALQGLQEQHSQFKSIEGRGLQYGDVAIVDWVMNVEGAKPEIAKDRWIPIDKKYFIPNFCEPLIGAKKGDQKEINVSLPKDFPKKELEGKKAKFEIQIKEIKEKQKPELNDDFAKDLGKFDTLEKLKEELKKQLKDIKEKEEEKDVKEQIIKYLLKEYDFELPGFLVENMSQEIRDRALHQMRLQRIAQKEIDNQKEALGKKAQERAQSEVRLAYLTDAIAREESLKVEKEDIQQYIMQLVQSGQNPAYVEQYFSQPENVEKLKAQVLEEKVLQFLSSQGKIKVE